MCISLLMSNVLPSKQLLTGTGRVKSCMHVDICSYIDTPAPSHVTCLKNSRSYIYTRNLDALQTNQNSRYLNISNIQGVSVQMYWHQTKQSKDVDIKTQFKCIDIKITQLKDCKHTYLKRWSKDDKGLAFDTCTLCGKIR